MDVQTIQKISSTSKLGGHIPCGYSMSTIWAFDHLENKHTLYREKGCIKKFCSSLRKHATNILNVEKEKMLPLTKEQLKLDQDTTNCYICGKTILKKLAKNKNYWKVRDHYH